MLVHNRDKRENHNEVHVHIHNHNSNGNDRDIDDDIDDQKERRKRNKRRKKRKNRKCGPNDTRKKCIKQMKTTSNPNSSQTQAMVTESVYYTTPESDMSTNSWVYTNSKDIYTHEVITDTPLERETPEGYTQRVTTISEKDIQYRKANKEDKHVVRGD